ncbi:MAG: hypothetical protein HQL45_13625 [Alphaproteobacteria bacterium]|nr:hypothetical protein [Alphaproteobacteria bacterium]
MTDKSGKRIILQRMVESLMVDVTLELLGQMMQRSLDMQRELSADVRELKSRMTDIERGLGRNAASETEHYASVMGRMDRVDDRIDRVERRLDIGDA